ncbi:4-diphosphocytidyl-2C-methyl-D-erythritol kinase [Brucella melitensis]|uniref:Uncharacterized protein n=7 Tax=Brucella TaxID=234 RepID=Q2YMB6_BRUA2|nr:hypothetical protein BR0393 [Brucella suis 1330]AAX73814.1 hypothetical protein BruAb1_0417 [Brucella abortus bv. 1 str. 9-941]ABY37509.1 Hypothetical protein, conserved [Brucella suis ATCC 23445]ACU47406.1 hypothetical protein BMI_I397 [Brucella microti CCM 4915]AEU05420.1 hypothetical protein BSVBI22_A0394 [Brucella suis VBI22]AHN46048.1 hypothetical protein BSS2_I0386 [Brucella suis bv. 1 str. S2]APX69478.1 4-diphosphocytidyl-2C-methyl-D-erythritol kinase [Brucella sp. 09RB8471]APY1345
MKIRAGLQFLRTAFLPEPDLSPIVFVLSTDRYAAPVFARIFARNGIAK